MDEIIFLPTIPNTGTHFVWGLVESHPNIGSMSLDGRYPTYPLVNLLEDGHITEEDFCLAAQYYANMRAYHLPGKTPVGFSTLSCLNEIRSRLGVDLLLRGLSPYEYVAVYSHLCNPGLNGKRWVSDLIKMGYRCKTITSLRDPMMVVTSTLLKVVGSAEETDLTYYKQSADSALQNIFQQFIALQDFPSDLPIFYVPIDLLARSSARRRFVLFHHLFRRFLGIGFNRNLSADLTALYQNWPVAHPTKEPKNDNLITRKLIDVRERISRFQEFDSLVPHVDQALEFFRRMDCLKEIYQKAGYENLSWF